MSGRRRPRKKHAAADPELEVVRRAREALPELPMDALYRIHELLERALSQTELDDEILASLEAAMDGRSRDA